MTTTAGRERLALERIAAIMRERGSTDDFLLSEIQDELTMAGYDVPLRTYRPVAVDAVGPLLPSEDELAQLLSKHLERWVVVTGSEVADIGGIARFVARALLARLKETT